MSALGYNRHLTAQVSQLVVFRVMLWVDIDNLEEHAATIVGFAIWRNSGEGEVLYYRCNLEGIWKLVNTGSDKWGRSRSGNKKCQMENLRHQEVEISWPVLSRCLRACNSMEYE